MRRMKVSARELTTMVVRAHPSLGATEAPDTPSASTGDDAFVNISGEIKVGP